MAARKNGGERFGALSARVGTLIETVRVQRAEMHDWRLELRGDIASLRVEMQAGIAQAARASAALAERVEAVEKSDVAKDAVEKYKRWLIGTIALAGGSLVLNVAGFARALLF